MQEILPPAPSPAPLPFQEVLRVSQLNHLARQALEQRFPLLWVAGEVSNLTRATSGHLYFSLKDEGAQVRCAMFRNRAQLLPWRLENGMQVEARAVVTLYEARGDYQLNVEALRRAGIGALFEAFARLRDRLAAEGLFDPDRKRALPAYPRRIGLISSLQAAALKDVLATLARRAPHLPVVIYPTAVQGEGAATQIAAALKIAGERRECEVLILARGGGSIEDLWSFNEEIVARAIRACPIPVVSGVGHETDTTISDFAADRRAATPTAAAELVSAGFVEAEPRLERLHRALVRAIGRTLESRAQRLDTLGYRLVHPGQSLARGRLACAHLGTRLSAALSRRLEASRRRLAQAEARLARVRPDTLTRARNLEQLSRRLPRATAQTLFARQKHLETLADHLLHLNPEAVLGRGYSIVWNGQGNVVRDAGQLATGEELRLQFALGSARAKVTEITQDS
ncbi:MAG: exodeoxyribonuclease VII large subunit [Rhodocyclaceae bacterium]|nr:exodeoxyribonuclease VII large subunit [Rhodocyclaceae bacterium]